MARAVHVAILVVLSMGLTSASIGFDDCMKNFVNGFIPMGPNRSVRICKAGVIAITYDAEMVDPAYSAYHVTPTEAQNPISGRLDFYRDPDLEALGIRQASVDAEAFSDTWNRGHLAPNHIMSWSEDAKKATFTMANVAPQGYYFNQHPWEQLETAVMSWIAANNELHIITAVAYKDRSNPRRSTDGIAVPDYYVKVLCDAANAQSVGFFGANEPDNHDPPKMVSVADVENLFGAQLFPTDTCKTRSFSPSYWWSTAYKGAAMKYNVTKNRV